MDWPRCRNVRDLGGLPVRGQQHIRAGALIRSDNLDQLDDRGMAAFRSAGVSRVVDVRSAWECQTFPSPVMGDAVWINVPLSDAGDPDESRLPLAEQYCLSLDRRCAFLGEAVTAIASAPPGAVVVTCHAGRDRTGVLVALVLSCLGVADEAIGQDYATVGAEPCSVDEAAQASRHHLSLPEDMPLRADTILATLRHVRSRYGDVRSYLRRGGATADGFAALRNRLVEQRPRGRGQR